MVEFSDCCKLPRDLLEFWNVWNHKKRSALEKNNFVSSADAREVVELAFQHFHIRNQWVNYLRPCPWNWNEKCSKYYICENKCKSTRKLQTFHVQNHSPVQCFIPNWRRIAFHFESNRKKDLGTNLVGEIVRWQVNSKFSLKSTNLLLWSTLNQRRPLAEGSHAIFLRYQIHFMNQNENRGIRAVLLHRLEDTIK